MATARIDYEIEIIGMLLNCPINRKNILEFLKLYRFDSNCQKIINAVKSLEYIDGGAVIDYLENNKQYNVKIGDIIAQACMNYITSANYSSICKRLLEGQLKDSIKNAETIEDISLIKELQSFIEENTSKEIFSHIGKDEDSDLEHYCNTYDKVIKSGFKELDYITKGFYGGEYITIAAATGAGKTAFALNLCRRIVDQKKNVLFISLEMSKREIRKRLNCAELHINSLLVRGHELGDKQADYFNNLNSSINKLPVWINDEYNITLNKIESYARLLKRQGNLDVIIIDYLTLLQTSDRFRDKREEVCYLTRGLKLLARTLDVPVFCLAQLSRAPEARSNKRPILSDLKESSSIEQDSDFVIFLYRDDYYNSESDKKGILEAAVAKARDTMTGNFELNFVKEYQQILDVNKQFWKSSK